MNINRYNDGNFTKKECIYIGTQKGVTILSFISTVINSLNVLYDLYNRC